MNKSKIPLLILSLILLIVLVSSSGCTFDPGNLINQKKEQTGDIVQYTSNIAGSNNNSYHISGLVENKCAEKYSYVNLTVTGYNAKKEVVSEGKLTLTHVAAHDYETYDIWLRSPTGEKITSTTMTFINGTKG